MRYVCSKCGDAFVAKPASGTCPKCDAPLVVESEAQEAEPREESEDVPVSKRRL